MPFCRKCGRRLPEYSEICPDCRTSTTAPLIKIKKTQSNSLFKVVAPTKVAKAIIPVKTVISVKVVAQTKGAKTNVKAKTTAPAKPIIVAKPVTQGMVYPPHEILKSNLSVEKDIITNPQDYETQVFDVDLKCSNGHFWPAGKELPVSKGKAFCQKCGQRLAKPKRNKQRRYHKY